MALIISTNKGTFDVPTDFSISVETSSPIYSERGSQTISATLPGTLHNMALMDNIHRLDVAKMPDKDMITVLADGIFRRRGKLNIISASKNSGLVCNMGFDESLMYQAWNDLKLCDLPNLPIVKFDTKTAVIDHLNQVLGEKIETDYHIFAVTTKDGILNDTEKGLLKSDYKEITKKIDNKDVVIKVSKGYLITPFIKVSFVLDFLFSAFGYKLIENPYRSHYQLKRQVILNNRADTIYPNCIDYKMLMPDCTVNDFLESIFARTGACIFVDSNTMTARIRLIKDIIQDKNVDDITLLAASDPIVTFVKPTRIKLSGKTSLEGAAPAVESYSDMLTMCQNCLSEVRFLDDASGKFNYVIELPTRNIFKRDIFADKPLFFSSPFFAWDKKEKTDMDVLEITGKDECVPMKRANDASYYEVSFLTECVLSYTFFAGILIEKNTESKAQPWGFCFALYDKVALITRGSTTCRSHDGNRHVDKDGNVYDISLTFADEEGAYNRFFKEYDAVLRNSNRTVEREFNLSKQQLANFDMMKVRGLNGQRLLVESVQYTLPLNSSIKMKLHTIKYDSSKLLGETTQYQKFYWRVNDAYKDAYAPIIRRFFSSLGLTPYTIRDEIRNIKLTTPLESDFPYPLPTSLSDPQHSRDYPFEFDYVYHGQALKADGSSVLLGDVAHLSGERTVTIIPEVMNG